MFVVQARLQLDGTQDAGNYEVVFDDSAGGTGGQAGGFTLTGYTEVDFNPYSFDNDLNGTLSYYGLPPLAGAWLVTIHVLDANSNSCGSAGPTTVNFLAPGEGSCAPPVCNLGMITSATPQTLCAGAVGDITLDAVPEADGGFAIGWDNTAGGGTGALGNPFNLTGINATDFPYSVDEDLGGLLSANSYPPFAGMWDAKVYALDYLGVPCDSTNVITFNFAPASDPACCSCEPPTNISVDLGTDPNRVNILWDPPAAPACTPIEYQVRYRRVLTTAWNNLATTNTQRVVQVLVQNKVYDYRLRSKCDDGNGGFIWSAMTPIVKFRTVPCDEPTGMMSTQLTNNKVRVEWSEYTYGDKYQIWYRLAGSSDAWGSLVTFQEGMVARVISNLTPGAQYEWKVRSFCEVSYGPWTDLQYFTNMTIREGQFDFGVQQVFPNPAKDRLNVQFTLAEKSDVNFVVTDLLGREVMNVTSPYFEGANNEVFDIQGFDSGNYMMRITNGDNVSVKKFMKL